MISDVKEESTQKDKKFAFYTTSSATRYQKGFRNGERNMIPAQSQAESFF